MKKVFIGLAAAGTALAIIPMFSAFEAHVINVTARIENALNVPVKFLEYGTVFPQEYLVKPVQVELSQSFFDEPRVDDVEYFIRQKPKCAITTEGGTLYDNTVVDGVHAYTRTGHIVLGDDPSTTSTVETDFVTIDCGDAPRTLLEDEAWGVLPSLCPYLSKHKDVSENTEPNETQIDAFHTPYVVSGTEVVYLDAEGYLAKSNQDIEDTWQIDLAVPCFGNYCAQDWATFVESHNEGEGVNAESWTQDIANEHKVFGCDLWVEVSGVSETPVEEEPTTGTVTVTKVVVNDDLPTPGIAVVADFALSVGGEAVVSGVSEEFAPGDYVVSEVELVGYTATYSGDCDAQGNLTVVAGNSYTCTITNDDNIPT